MKKLKKYCKNPECEQEILEYKSSKREYCNDYCRNRYGYLRRLEENHEINLFSKGYSKNYQLLKLHKDAGILDESLDKYEKLGFNPRYIPQRNKMLQTKKEYFTIKDIDFFFDNVKDTIKIIN
jgi:hypothetical protein